MFSKKEYSGSVRPEKSLDYKKIFIIIRMDGLLFVQCAPVPSSFEFRNPEKIWQDQSFEWNLKRLYQRVRSMINREAFFRIPGKNPVTFSKFVKDRIMERSDRREKYPLSQLKDSARCLMVPEDQITQG